MNLLLWIKSHLVIVLLGLIVVYLVLIKPFLSRQYLASYSNTGVSVPMMDVSYGVPSMAKSYAPLPSGESVALTQTDRKVVEEGTLSLQVKNVSDSITQIKSQAEILGGFMVSGYVSSPQESSSGSIVIRVPQNKLDEMLAFAKNGSVKVVSENLSGKDVTDQYSDIQAKLNTLTQTKLKFEAIMDSAKTVDEILRVQEKILYVQDQIDSLKGQSKYLENVSSSARISIYLAEDEFSLPYAPKDSFRPDVIFKLAVRSLVTNMRSLMSFLIWVGVYSVIWTPIAVVIYIIKRKFLNPPKK